MLYSSKFHDVSIFCLIAKWLKLHETCKASLPIVPGSLPSPNPQLVSGKHIEKAIENADL